MCCQTGDRVLSFQTPLLWPPNPSLQVRGLKSRADTFLRTPHHPKKWREGLEQCTIRESWVEATARCTNMAVPSPQIQTVHRCLAGMGQIFAAGTASTPGPVQGARAGPSAPKLLPSWAVEVGMKDEAAGQMATEVEERFAQLHPVHVGTFQVRYTRSGLGQSRSGPRLGHYAGLLGM